jgi:hypothetical protein
MIDENEAEAAVEAAETVREGRLYLKSLRETGEPQSSGSLCIYPGCTHTRRTRGLCHGHYSTMRSYARLGRADEHDLMRRGLLLPEGTGGAKVEVGHDAFLKGSTVLGRAFRSSGSKK